MSSSIPESPDHDRHESEQRPGQSWRRRPRLVGLCVILFTFGPALFFAAWEAGREDTSGGQGGDGTGITGELTSSGNPKSQDGVTGTTASPNGLPTGSRSLADHLSEASAQQLRDVERELQETQAAWTQLDQDARRWDEGPRRLFSPEQSRKLASDTRSVNRVAMLLDRDRPSVRDVEALGKRLAAFRQALEQLQQETRNPIADFRRELKKLLDEIKSAQKQFIRDGVDLKELETFARVGSDQGASLDDAIQAARQEIAANALEPLIREIHDNAKATEDKFVGEVQRAVRKEEQQHLETVRNERDRVQKEKQRIEEELAAQALARQQETEKLELKSRFELEYPEMKQYLVGFTTDGYRQFVGGGFRTITKVGPLSYQGMINAGILNEGSNSLRAFHGSIGGHKMNDRDLGAFPICEGGAYDFDAKYQRLYSIQTFIREFGPLMVEMKLLAP